MVIRGEGTWSLPGMEAEVIAAAQELQAQIPGLRAVVLECSNLATYSRAVSEALGLPVFDTISAARQSGLWLCPAPLLLTNRKSPPAHSGTEPG